jgi:hypothetical protein
MERHRFESAYGHATPWWTLLKVPDHRDFIREIRDVDSPWRKGFLAKSTTLMDVSKPAKSDLRNGRCFAL